MFFNEQKLNVSNFTFKKKNNCKMKINKKLFYHIRLNNISFFRQLKYYNLLHKVNDSKMINKIMSNVIYDYL